MKTTTLTSLAASIALATLALTTGCVAPDESPEDEANDEALAGDDGDDEEVGHSEGAISATIQYPSAACGKTVTAYQTFVGAMHQQKSKSITVCGSTAPFTFGITCVTLGQTLDADTSATNLAPAVSAAVSTGGDLSTLGYRLSTLEGTLQEAQTGSVFPSGWASVWTAYHAFTDQLGACSASRASGDA